MCKNSQLNFVEYKEKVVVGISSRRLASFAVSKTHYTKDHLLQDLVNFQRINIAREERERARHFRKTLGAFKQALAQIHKTFVQLNNIR